MSNAVHGLDLLSLRKDVSEEEFFEACRNIVSHYNQHELFKAPACSCKVRAPKARDHKCIEEVHYKVVQNRKAEPHSSRQDSFSCFCLLELRATSSAAFSQETSNRKGWREDFCVRSAQSRLVKKVIKYDEVFPHVASWGNLSDLSNFGLTMFYTTAVGMVPVIQRYSSIWIKESAEAQINRLVWMNTLSNLCHRT